LYAYGRGNSDIIFLPDINPLSAFEYPTNYHWDFDDGSTSLDNVDGGGFAMHRYVLESGGSYPRANASKLSTPSERSKIGGKYPSLSFTRPRRGRTFFAKGQTFQV
jgi:hypothetical protein